MATHPIRTFTVLPSLPARLGALHELAYNLWWCWHSDAVALFRRIDPERFDALDHSPIRLIHSVPQSRFEELAQDDGFLAHLDRVSDTLHTYLSAKTWYQQAHGDADMQVAYFSAEFGIHESVPVYSGGLGVLAGDHLKSASDLGIPLVGVSLMYREGYFRQYLNHDGWQQERYPENDFFNLPINLETRPDGSPLTVSVRLPGREVFIKVWNIKVGRIKLYLLDCNIAQNRPEDRAITAQLYGGDLHTRIQQEIVLGIGGLRALRALGLSPTVCHMNEGHAAFCGLERVRTLIEKEHLDFATALEAVKAGNCFTTHTPVPAGNDAFDSAMMDQYFGEFIPSLKLDRTGFLNLGRERRGDEAERFSMTVLALRISNVSNGVAKLHGVVSRKMWNGLWPGLPEAEVPITSVTNGVHTMTWMAPDIEHLYVRYLGTGWQDSPSRSEIWKKVENIPDEELWRTHERCRERLVTLARKKHRERLRKQGAPASEVASAAEILDPEALTIGFARRFATYKRGTLIFRDYERLLRLLNNKERPVQLIFSGKSHPKDTGGKDLIAQVAQFSRRPELKNRLVFLEDYEMNIARHMIQGVDVWLNNPRRPLEASGTSGMKICVNGGLNCSILDGWWDEAYEGDNGYAIGAGEEYSDEKLQDDVESRALYDLIERDIVGEFYLRGSDGLPREWLKRMKRSIISNVPKFNTHRMVEEYTQRSYIPSNSRFGDLSADHLKKAHELAEYRRKLFENWGRVRVESVDAPPADILKVGGELRVGARVQLAGLTPDEVDVQLFHGPLDSFGEISHASSTSLTANGAVHHGEVGFAGTLPCSASGQYGFCVRVMPKHPLLASEYEPAMLVWG